MRAHWRPGNVRGTGFNDIVVGANGTGATPSNTAQDELFANNGDTSRVWHGFASTGTPIGSVGAVTTSVALGDVNGTGDSASSSATRRAATSCTSETAPPPAVHARLVHHDRQSGTDTTAVALVDLTNTNLPDVTSST